MAEDVIKVRVEADGQQAKAELAGVSKSIEEVGESAKTSSAGLGGLVEKYSSLIEAAGKFVVASKLIGAALAGVSKAVRDISALYGGLDDETGELVNSTEKLGQAIARLDIMEAAAQLGRTLANVYIDLTDATKSAAVSNDAYLASVAKAREQLESVIAIQNSFVQGLERERAALDLRAQAFVRQAESERLAGEVQDATRDQLQKLLETYARLGDAVPANLQKVTDALGIVTREQEAAAEAAEKAAAREIEAAEKAAAREEERAVREAEAHAKRVAAALDAAIAKEEAAAREVAAAEAGVRAIEDELRQFADADTPEGLAELNAELADLRSQDILTPQQLKRLQDLEDITGSITAGARDWRVESEKLAKQNKILTRLEEARAKALELEEKRLAAMLETLAIQNREFREAANTTNDFGGAAGDAAMSFEELERANADALDTAGRFGGEADDLAGTLGDLGEAAGDFSKELGDLAKETDKADSGFGKMGEQADELIPKLEEIKRLVSEIKEEAGSISLGL